MGKVSAKGPMARASLDRQDFGVTKKGKSFFFKHKTTPATGVKEKRYGDVIPIPPCPYP